MVARHRSRKPRASQGSGVRLLLLPPFFEYPGSVWVRSRQGDSAFSILTTTCLNPNCGDRTAYCWDTSTEHGIYCGACGYEERHKHHNPQKWRTPAKPGKLRLLSGDKRKLRASY